MYRSHNNMTIKRLVKRHRIGGLPVLVFLTNYPLRDAHEN